MGFNTGRIPLDALQHVYLRWNLRPGDVRWWGSLVGNRNVWVHGVPLVPDILRYSGFLGLLLDESAGSSVLGIRRGLCAVLGNWYGNFEAIMIDSRVVEQAAEHLRLTGHAKALEANPLKLTSTRKEHISHIDTANALIKIINVTPGIHAISRKVMSMRIINPGISVLAVALELGIRELDVVKYEKQGKERVKAFIDRSSLQEHTNKFNVERSIENELKNLNKTKQNPLLS